MASIEPAEPAEPAAASKNTFEALKNPRDLPDYKFVYLLALEADAPNPNWEFGERALDTLVQLFQPSPTITHVELFIPPEFDPLLAKNPQNVKQQAHFATYVNRKSNWGEEFENSKCFYTRGPNQLSWRALPILAPKAQSLLRYECNQNINTPYGKLLSCGVIPRLFDYPMSIPPLRSLASFLSDERHADAHCATLSARCLRHALPNLSLPHADAWFGPSTLWIELARESRMLTYQRQLKTTTFDKNEGKVFKDKLLRDDNDGLKLISHDACHAGTECLAREVVDAIVEGDPTKERNLQKELARALLRWTQERNLEDTPQNSNECALESGPLSRRGNEDDVELQKA